MSEIRIYVEGGGDEKFQQAKFRDGFNSFLREFKSAAEDKNFEWYLIACGSRNVAYKWFQESFKAHPGDDVNLILLVDSERPVTTPEWEHLTKPNDKWDLNEDQGEFIHLMVECMEAWLIEDLEAIENYYGDGFNIDAFDTADVRKRRKNPVIIALQASSRRTSKEKYSKIWHGSELLACIDPTKVRNGAPHCDRLFSHLEKIIENS